MPHKPKKPKAPPRDYAAEWAAQKAKDERQAQTKASARAKADEDLIDEQMRRAAMNQKARLGDIARAIITASEIC